MPVPTIVLRIPKGAPLTPGEMDNNLAILRDFSNGLEANLATIVDVNGNFLPGIINANALAAGSVGTTALADQSVTPPKLANVCAGQGLLKVQNSDPLSVNVDGVTIGFTTAGPTFSGQFVLANNPGQNDTLTLNINGTPVVLTFVQTIGATTGNVLIGLTSQITAANALSLLQNPGTTTGTGVALSSPNQVLVNYFSYSAAGSTINVNAGGSVTSLSASTSTAGNNFYPITSAQIEVKPGSIGLAQLSADAAIGGAYILLQDQRGAGADGDPMPGGVGVWTTRTLQTIVVNTGGNLIGLASNQINLKAGTYRCRIEVPGYLIAQNAARLYNVTGNVPLVLGTGDTTRTSDSESTFSKSLICGVFTLTDDNQQLIIQHQCLGSNTLNGGGQHTGIQSEIYCVCELIKVA